MSETLTNNEQRARYRVCLALDNIKHTNDAIELAKEIKPYVKYVKIGKELHALACNEGVPIINKIMELNGLDIFLDLKFHDTPNTVYQAAKAVTVPGVNIFNVHISGGEEMCKKALEGARDGVKGKAMPVPRVIGVTELTSLNDKDLEEQGLGIKYKDLVMRRAELGKKWGLDGLVCPGNQAGEIEMRLGRDDNFIYLTPGIEWGGVAGVLQKQKYGPVEAIRDCSNSILVIGSAITKQPDKKKTAYEILQAMSKEI